jgi:hypothetical protein
MHGPKEVKTRKRHRRVQKPCIVVVVVVAAVAVDHFVTDRLVVADPLRSVPNIL